nr:MAG TPA: hypothetical protein [Caudoviricetes sp.]
MILVKSHLVSARVHRPICCSLISRVSSIDSNTDI